jgi:tetratricopeptide (TPR) repeat protein
MSTPFRWMRLTRSLVLGSAVLVSPATSRAEARIGDRDEGPVIAGPRTETAARSEELFDMALYYEAAPLLQGVAAGETGDDEGNREIAQYHLAVALFRVKLYEACFGVLSAIADQPRHRKRRESLFWLSRLAHVLPDPRDAIERIGAYAPSEIAPFDSPQQREIYWDLSYLLGQHFYRRHRREDAIRHFEKVDWKSRHFVEARFLSGILHAERKEWEAAVKSFQRSLVAIDDGMVDADDEDRVRDLLNLSIARAFYTSSFLPEASPAAAVDPIMEGEVVERGTPAPAGAPIGAGPDRAPPGDLGVKVDVRRLSAAVKYWGRIDELSEFYLDALLEGAWAWFLAGNYPRALGNLQTLEAPYFRRPFYDGGRPPIPPGPAGHPEADVLRALVSLKLCHDDDAITIVARMKREYEPIQRELEATLRRLEQEGTERPLFQLADDLRRGNAHLSPAIRPFVERAFADRALSRSLAQVRAIDEELARLQSAPAPFLRSPLGHDVAGTLAFARDSAVVDAGALARERYERALHELAGHLHDGSKLLADIATAKAGKLDRRSLDVEIVGDAVPPQYDVLVGPKQVRWRFDGEYWRDEIGHYRQAVSPTCAR